MLVTQLHVLLLVLVLGTLHSVNAAVVEPRRSSARCQPVEASFTSDSDVSQSQFQAVSPPGSYATDDEGLKLYLEKPRGTVHTKDGVNDVVAEGATMNSTFYVQYGKISFEIAAPEIPGVVTAAILVADQRDEIDVEILGGDTTHWQSNVFTASPADQEPLWGVFGEIEGYAEKGTVTQVHRYAIDWNEERIVWSVDGEEMRTLRKSDTSINGTLHYPSHAARIQLGIWDASNPAGTSEWAKGPIDWNSAPAKMSATFKSITVECPY